MPTTRPIRFITLLLTALLLAAGAYAAPKTHPANGKLKVFILAGQSNMVGFGQVEGGVGTMRHYVKTNPKAYGHLVKDGDPAARKDVWVVNISDANNPQTGHLTVGFGAKGNHIGPEYGFGWAVGEYYEDPVLIIKSAWGGRSLFHNFLPPSAADYAKPEKDGDQGFHYAEVVRHAEVVTANLKKYYPDYDGKGFEVVGFGWHQGWNDRINQQAVDVYEQNLAHFINDIRKDFGLPGLPFVIANTGMGGWDIPETARYKQKVEKLMEAQLALADPEKHPALKGTVAGVETRGFQRTREQSPSGQEFHWMRNWETYYLIGESMGKAMVGLVEQGD